MATANGYWRLPSPHISRVPTFGAPKQKKQRNHHYTFDVDDNGLDINGFILHTDKHKGKRQKFRVYLDSNENGRFDKSDRLIGRAGLKQKHAAKGVGNLLDEDELGQLEVKFKKTKSNASMRADEDHTVPNMLGSSGGDGEIIGGAAGAATGIVGTKNYKLHFIHPDGNTVAYIPTSHIDFLATSADTWLVKSYIEATGGTTTESFA